LGQNKSDLDLDDVRKVDPMPELAEGSQPVKAEAAASNPLAERCSGVTWLRFSRPRHQEGFSWKDYTLTVLTVVVAIGPAVLGLPVFWRFLLWFFCLMGCVHVLLSVLDLYRLPRNTIVGVYALVVMSCLPFKGIAVKMWRVEQSEKLEGDLSACSKPCPTDKNLLDLGGGGAVLEFGDHAHIGLPDSTETDQLGLLYDAGLRIGHGQFGPTISTPIRDRDGFEIAEINNNHWRVLNSPYVADKNYTRNSLEVKDKRGHVVLQVQLLRDRVKLAGEWRDEFGRGVRVTPSKQGGAFMIAWGDTKGESKVKGMIPEIFRYPSSEHWGELIVQPSFGH
jgi:hypothetical protein